MPSDRCAARIWTINKIFSIVLWTDSSTDCRVGNKVMHPCFSVSRDSYDQAAQIYSEVHSAAVKLARLSDKRLAKLEKAYHVKRFEEDARKVLTWICKKGEDGLQRHFVTGENLNELRQQQREFEKFYFTASVSETISVNGRLSKSVP